MQERHLQTQVSGRYLVEMPPGDSALPLLVGFHGYGQTAEDGMELLRGIPGSDRWLLCAVEALHPFMNSKGDPGACWMTRRDRDLRIAENVAYVDAVLDRVMKESMISDRVVLHGFSQGAGMACRAALLGRHPVAGVMLLGGEIPPELDSLGRLTSVHLARGDRDRFYPADRFETDGARLRDSGLAPDAVTFHGGHGPNAEYFALAGRFLGTLEKRA